MNTYSIRDNLKRTIAGKQALAKSLDRSKTGVDMVAQFLDVNINELEKILADVELCYKKESDESWATNPDRMGGAFTADEITESTTWR
jgi:hypothetical protein